MTDDMNELERLIARANVPAPDEKARDSAISRAMDAFDEKNAARRPRIRNPKSSYGCITHCP